MMVSEATNPFFSSGWVVLWILISWWLGLVATMAVLWQPAAAYRATGRSKFRWFLLELVGGLIGLGLFTWIAFRFRVREDLKKNGGKLGIWQSTPEEKAAKQEARRAAAARLAAAEVQERNQRAAAPYSRERSVSSQSSFTSTTREVSCSSCSGSGHKSCPTCHGTNQVSNGTEFGGTANAYRYCDNWQCSSGQVTCTSCSGRGKVKVNA